MMRCLLSLLLALYLWQSPQALQAQCGSPDTNCDELVNVNDLLVLLGYFGTVGNEAWTEAEDCSSPDVNCDGNVNVEDLLGLLSYYGQSDADSDGIWDSEDDCVCAFAGCTDNSACNYDPQATEDDGSCVEEWAKMGWILTESRSDESGRSVSLSDDGRMWLLERPTTMDMVAKCGYMHGRKQLGQRGWKLTERDASSAVLAFSLAGLEVLVE